MNALTPAAANPAALKTAAPSPRDHPDTREAFRDLVAGTFYKQMLAELRSAERPVPYLDGGQAEQIFRERLDATLAENFADSHGDAFVGDLYEVFTQNLATRQPL